ncbi:MAG: hypothetical protein H6974_06045 [Gammaproteobacteria bacterium]|nr:hypothetical protein [Gammaproteobacteria bacterium]
MLALVPYPYVYLLARAAFLEQSWQPCWGGVANLGVRPGDVSDHHTLPLAHALISWHVAGADGALYNGRLWRDCGISGSAPSPPASFRSGSAHERHATAASRWRPLLCCSSSALLVCERLSRRQTRFHPTGQRTQRPHLRLSRSMVMVWRRDLPVPLLCGL